MFKKLFLIISLILVLILFSIYNFIYETCPELNQDYFKWFPYHKNSILIFEQEKNPSKIIQFEIENFELHHTGAYMKFAKCGHCEDDLFLKLVNKKDTLEIVMNNLDNQKSVFGYSLYLYKNSKLIKHIEKDSLLLGKKETIILSDEYFFVKGSGLIKIKIDNNSYHLKKVIKNGNVRKIHDYGC